MSGDESASWPTTVLDDLPLLWEVVGYKDDFQHTLRDGLTFKGARRQLELYRELDVAGPFAFTYRMQPMGMAGRA